MAIKKFKVTASAKAKRAVNAGMTYKVGRTYNTDHSDGPYAVYEINEDMSPKGWTSFDGKSTVGKAEIRHMSNGKEFPNSIEDTFEGAVELAKRYNEDEAADRVWELQHGDVNSACGKKSIKSSSTKDKRTVKAGATLERENDTEIVLRDDDGAQLRVVKHPKVKGYVLRRTLNNGGGSRFEWDQSKQIYDTPEEAKQAALDGTATFHFKDKSEVPPKPVQSATKKSVKASASAKRRASKRPIKAYIEEYPNWVYDWTDKKTEQNKRKYDEKLNEWYDVAESMYPEFYSLKGADRKAAIEEVNKAVGFTMDDVFSSSTRPVKASASAKRRASKKITASDTSNDIVMYFNGNNVYQGSVYDLADAVENLCYDEDVNAKFQEWCNQFGDPFDFDGSPIDTAAVFTDIIIHEADEAEEHSDFYEDGDGILDFEILYAIDAVEGSVKKSVRASIDSDYDTKVLRELEDYIKDNYPIYVDTEYAVYENENDWSVGLFATLGMVESDFEYYLNEQNPYLYNRLTETGLIGGPNAVVSGNDFQIQLYPAQGQWRGPQLDIDETNLANAGDDGSVYAELKTQIDAFEIMYINALQELNYHMGDLLRKYDESQSIYASTDVNADLQLNKYPGDREKYSYSKNSITDIDGYVQDIADGVVEKFPDLEYEISDEAITFTRDGNVIYVQAIDEIVPERDDLNDDIDELASAIQMDDELNAMREDFDAGWNATYDSDTATRAVEMSVNDDLEPIMGDDYEEEDMGFGFTTSGEAISESMVDELCRIANEILEKSELAKYDEYTSIDRDTFDYWCNGSTYVSEKFYIYFTFTQNGGWFINNDMVDFSDSRGISETEEFTFECDINIKDGKVVEVLYNDMPDNYSADMIDVPALTEYIEKLATPVARDIYNGTTNI